MIPLFTTVACCTLAGYKQVYPHYPQKIIYLWRIGKYFSTTNKQGFP